ncbi:MAG: IS200/IS605 family transposase [Verrucomicrobiae bacterium]|nr:IS200/IS605 family transposase [Verrucomicrobiae bacterium]
MNEQNNKALKGRDNVSQSLANILVHAIWSVKERRPLITEDVRAGLHAYMAGILKKIESPALIINSVADHVHVLCQLSKNLAACKLIEEVKKSSSKWMKTQGVSQFAWQSGYGAFSVSQSNVPSVRNYIENQATHHQRCDFKSEFRAFCERYGVTIDEHYVWD